MFKQKYLEPWVRSYISYLLHFFALLLALSNPYILTVSKNVSALLVVFVDLSYIDDVVVISNDCGIGEIHKLLCW